MKDYITRVEFERIENLVNLALSASSKKDAQTYIKHLEFISNCGGYIGYVNSLLSVLCASVKSASGRVSNKERLEYYARTDLQKLEWKIKEET